MKRQALSLLLVTALITSVFAGAVGTVAAQDGTTTPTADDDDAENNSTSLSVGQQLGVVIDTQSTDIQTEFDDARFQQRMKNAENREAAAQARATELQTEVADLRAERKALIEEFRAGNISKSDFLARLSTVNHKLDKKSELATRAEVESRTYGVNADALAELRADAENLTGGEVSAIARQVSKTGKAPGDVRADKNGNIQFTDENGSTIGVEYKVEGSENLNFDLARDNGSLTVTVRNADGEPVDGASVEINDRPAGTTAADGTLTITATEMRDSAEQRDELSLKVKKGDEEAEMEVRLKTVPDRDKVEAFHKKHADRLDDKHEEFHDRWDDKHEEFHERQNESAEEAGEQSEDAHESFHEQMDAEREQFEENWDTRRESFEAGLEAEANLTDEQRASAEAEFEAKYTAALDDFKTNQSARHDEFHAEDKETTETTTESTESHERFHKMMDRQHDKLHERLNRTAPKPPGLSERDSEKKKKPHDDSENKTRHKDDAENRDDDAPEDSDKVRTDEPLNLGIGVDGSLVTVTVLEGETPVQNATVTVEGEVVGTTDAQGKVSFEASADAQAEGEVDVTIAYGENEVETTVDLTVSGGAESEGGFGGDN